MTKTSKFTREYLTKVVREKYESTGKIPVSRDFSSIYPHFIREFGSWINALKTIFPDLPKNHFEKSGRKKTSYKNKPDQYFFDLIQEKANELGRTPKSIDMPALKEVIYRRFGGWKKALRLASRKGRVKKPNISDFNHRVEMCNRDVYSALKDRFLSHMKANNINYSTLAETMEVKNSYVSKLFHSSDNISIKTLIKMCLALNIDIKDVFNI